MANRLIALQAETVIVADDHPLFRTAIKEALQASQGETAFLEANSFESLQELVSSTPEVDLILLDLHMPKLDGIELTRAFRSEEKPGRHLPIIALTANAAEDVKAECLAAGMDDFLGKPVNPADLTAMVGRCTDRN